MKIKAELYKDARDDGIIEYYAREYNEPKCDILYEYRHFQSQSDTFNTSQRRMSYDDGITFTDWETMSDKSDDSRVQGEHVLENILTGKVYNHVHKHTVHIDNQFIYVGGYEYAMDKWWSGDTRLRPCHFFVNVSDDNGRSYCEMVKYEDGGDFDPDDWTNSEYLNKNEGYVVGSIIVDDNGDIIFPAEVPMRICCRMLGKDINDVFPSRPYFPSGIIVFKGKWDGERYNFTHSRPVIISDTQSSRGLNEPAIARLQSGRIVMIVRGSNMMFDDGNCRIVPGAPPVKWYAWSDDGGKTFCELMPWHFDDGEIIYSPASISHIVKDANTGKHYWIGNTSDHTAYGNDPRWTLNIVELDENYGTAVKRTFADIVRRREGESSEVQHSNFNVLQNRRNGNLEIYISKVGQFYDENDPGSTHFKGEVWRYEIIFD
ncbi:MAG: exo-alpha-sialidase [Clostridia bacterium]|nr:exo-alpha-sialidase [Clostridia bacterium]